MHRIADFSSDFSFQIAALPEADIPVLSAPGFPQLLETQANAGVPQRG